jgi:hypothetical protein
MAASKVGHELNRRKGTGTKRQIKQEQERKLARAERVDSTARRNGRAGRELSAGLAGSGRAGLIRGCSSAPAKPKGSMAVSSPDRSMVLRCLQSPNFDIYLAPLAELRPLCHFHPFSSMILVL